MQNCPCIFDILLNGITRCSGKIIRLVRVMRIMRIFKLVRHFAGLQSLIYTLNQAYKELGLLVLMIAVSLLTVRGRDGVPHDNRSVTDRLHDVLRGEGGLTLDLH